MKIITYMSTFQWHHLYLASSASPRRITPTVCSSYSMIKIFFTNSAVWVLIPLIGPFPDRIEFRVQAFTKDCAQLCYEESTRDHWLAQIAQTTWVSINPKKNVYKNQFMKPKLVPLKNSTKVIVNKNDFPQSDLFVFTHCWLWPVDSTGCPRTSQWLIWDTVSALSKLVSRPQRKRLRREAQSQIRIWFRPRIHRVSDHKHHHSQVEGHAHS